MRKRVLWVWTKRSRRTIAQPITSLTLPRILAGWIHALYDGMRNDGERGSIIVVLLLVIVGADDKIIRNIIMIGVLRMMTITGENGVEKEKLMADGHHSSSDSAIAVTTTTILILGVIIIPIIFKM